MHHDGVDGWVGWAACAGSPTHLFYPQKHLKAEAAKAICAKCPVTRECLEEALARNDQNGIWGGLSVEERKEVRRARNQQQQEQDAA